MPYTTEDQLDITFGEDAVTEVADRDSDGLRDDGVVDSALEWADTRINEYLAGKVPLPLSAPYPKRLIACATTLAMFHLFRNEVPDWMQSKFDAEMTYLYRFSRNFVGIGLNGDGASEVFRETIDGGGEKPLFSREAY